MPYQCRYLIWNKNKNVFIMIRIHDVKQYALKIRSNTHSRHTITVIDYVIAHGIIDLLCIPNITLFHYHYPISDLFVLYQCSHTYAR